MLKHICVTFSVESICLKQNAWIKRKKQKEVHLQQMTGNTGSLKSQGRQLCLLTNLYLTWTRKIYGEFNSS